MTKTQQQVGDGTTEWPRQPGVEITQTYDAAGRPCKRTQITRQEDRDLETGQFYGVIEDTLTSHYIHSSVLGARVAELTPSGQTNIWVYAGGQRIATTLAETAGNTTFEHHNPMTGSWVTTNGHSADRAAARQERDPLNGQLPLANPGSSTYAAQNPNQPLFILGGDPNDYSGGHEIDGLPVSNSEFARRVGNGSAVGAVLINGRPVAQIDLSRYAFMSSFSLRLDFWKTLTSENSNDSFLTPDEEHPGSSVETVSTSHAQEWLGALIVNFNFSISSRSAAAPQNYAGQQRSDLKADRDAYKREPIKYPGLTPCVKDYLGKFFDRAMLDAITWDHGIPWYVPMDAAAFTLDDMIYFGDGQYNPLNGISNEEMELIGHEVTHSRQYRQNGSLRQKIKYPIESAKNGIVGTYLGGTGLGWDLSYYGNKYEKEARGVEKKIREDLRKNGNPCK